MRTLLESGRSRVFLENVAPEIDGGKFAIQRTIGQRVVVSVDVLADGHDQVSCYLQYRKAEENVWNEVPMALLGNDRWQAEFLVNEIGRYQYTIEAWVDRFNTWRHNLRKFFEAGQNVDLELQIGSELIRDAVRRATGQDAEQLRRWSELLLQGSADHAPELALSDQLARKMTIYGDRSLSTQYGQILEVIVDRPRAGFSSWYEIFPRSCGDGVGHGTFRDLEARLPYIVSMGFDVLYLPPIHPIGRTHRKGRNARPHAEADDPGSPWAIGSEEGGHKAVHPQLGTLDDFDHLAAKAREMGIEIALDAAYQCSPDHPYVKEHPEWFVRRPDGSVQYAENPPKKYEDIYPFNFETPAWRELWQELKDILLFWIRHGVRIFRVDNPHTKPFPFWQWLIREIKSDYPDVLFLAEAFTRPKVMYGLAKSGFTQSYTFFTWRNTKDELTRYFTELTQTDVKEYFRPNLWPNTPDILTEYLQYGGRAAFLARLVLAGTLSPNYGIYGPAFELLENRAREPGSEEYMDSEKYQIRQWNFDSSDSLKDFVRRVNRIRRENAALQQVGNLKFHTISNEQLICYSRESEEHQNTILVVVNLDPHHTQSGWVELPIDDWEIPQDRPYQVHDLLGGARYLWQGTRNYVELNPLVVPAHIFILRRRVRTEQQFEYYM